MKLKTTIEPFRIKTVEPISMTTETERIKYLAEAKYNPFLLKAEHVLIDLLTDSGTSAMSSKQWAGILDADEAYAGSKSWLKMEKTVKELTGMPFVIPTHQGRAGERILYNIVGGKNKIFISNTHFDTTRANIEYSGATAIDIPIDEAYQPSVYHPFKGNMNTEKLEQLIIEHGAENIGAVILTVTNNSGGGQPVSMENAKAVSQICKKHNVYFFLDCCRIAENSYFVGNREEAYKHKTYKEIAQEMFSLADGTVMSSKKDALVNIGGFIALHNETIANQCKELLIITEGYLTYGGLAGRDMEALAIGLEEVFEPAYLKYRIEQVEYLGNALQKMGVPIILPIGGHAVYVDAKALYPHIPVEQYPGQVLTNELYTTAGIRAVEIGSVMFGKYDENGQLIPAPLELVRLAIPRRVYTKSHMDYIIEAFEHIIANKSNTRGLRITYEPKFLRHFTAHFEKV